MNKNLKKLLSLSSIYALGSIAQKALNLVLIPIYTTFLSTEDYGIIALMSIVVTLVAGSVSNPIVTALNRHFYAPEYKDKNGQLVFNLFLLLGIKTIFAAFIFWQMSNYLASTLLGNRDLVYIVKIYALILGFQPFSSFFESLLTMLEKAKYLVFVSIFRFLLSASLILYLLISLKMGVLAVILGNLVSVVFTVMMTLPIFIKISRYKFSPSLIIPPLKYGYPLLLSGYSSFLIQSGDRFVLRIFDSVSTVGLYSFGYQFASIINITMNIPLKHALNPIVFKQEENPEDLKIFLSRYATYFYLIGFLMCLFISLFSYEVIILIARKKEFWGSWIIVPIIAFSYVLHGLGNFLGRGMVMMKKSWHVSATILIAAIINIGLNFVFVPYWGIIGASFATLISYVAWDILRAYYSAKFYDLFFEIRRLAHISTVGFILYGFSLIVANTDSIILNLSIKSLIFIIFPLIIWITGFFTETEKKNINQLWCTLKQNGLSGACKKAKEISNLC